MSHFFNPGMFLFVWKGERKGIKGDSLTWGSFLRPQREGFQATVGGQSDPVKSVNCAKLSK